MAACPVESASQTCETRRPNGPCMRNARANRFAAAIQRAAKCAECWSIFLPRELSPRRELARGSERRFLKFAASVRQTNGEQSRLFPQSSGNLKFL